MYDVIRGLHRAGVTIIMITHDVAEALPYATHVLHIGRRLFWGTRAEYEKERPASGSGAWD